MALNPIQIRDQPSLGSFTPAGIRDGDILGHGVNVLTSKVTEYQVLAAMMRLNQGVTIANNGTTNLDFVVADPDTAFISTRNADGSEYGLARPTSMTKDLNTAWSSGPGGGALLGGLTIAANSALQLHCFAIFNSNTKTTDYACYNSIDPSAVMPSDYETWRWVGIVKYNGATTPALREFDQQGDWYFWKNKNYPDFSEPLGTSETTLNVDSFNGLNLLAQMTFQSGRRVGGADDATIKFGSTDETLSISDQPEGHLTTTINSYYNHTSLPLRIINSQIKAKTDNTVTWSDNPTGAVMALYIGDYLRGFT